MSKPQNSWPFIQRRCANIFGKDRFSADETTLRITFDLKSPVQRYEHDEFLLALSRYGIPYDAFANGNPMDAASIFIAKDAKVHIAIDPRKADIDDLNQSLLAIAHFTDVGVNTRNYNQDPVIKTLEKVSGTAWAGKVPNDYIGGMVYSPLNPDANLSHDQRAEQEQVLVEAFVPERKHPAIMAGDWLSHQRKVENSQGLQPATALYRDLLPLDREARYHLGGKLIDPKFTKRVKRAFGSDDKGKS